ncbi:MAG: ABC transporter ATP-binding protein [Hyphomicrobiales bacterium]|nr:ABC transporter ATP-binding protein [Hyphomicrobiales bacterium]
MRSGPTQADLAHLRIAGLHKAFGEFLAVDGVSLDISAGTLGTLLGPSGCGKTTTLRIVAGLEQPDSGRVELGGSVLCATGSPMIPPEGRRIGMVFQSYAVWPHMTAAENVAFPLQARKVFRSEIAGKVKEALRLVRLEAHADRYPGQLSGGQQQRVALARAIVFEPRLLLLDEPLSNLDASLREEMRIEIRSLQQRLGMTTLFVTHDQDEALSLSDTVAIMQRGRIVQAGRPRDVYERPTTPFVARFVGWKNFLRARVADSATVHVGDVPLALQSGGLSRGTEVDLCIRPEELFIRDASNGSDRDERELAGEVIAQLYKATHADLEVLVAGRMLSARVPASAEFVRGQPIFVRLAPEHVLMFPADTDLDP